MLTTYDEALLTLISGCVLLTWRQYYTRLKNHASEQSPLLSPSHSLDKVAEAQRCKRSFLMVHCLVMGADWLQGPYVYALYKTQYGLDERVVASLFTTGFLSAGLSSFFIGAFADRFGRKLACLSFCVIYSLACLLILIPNVPVLFLGRICGGLGTSLLFTVFESWMVTEYHIKHLDGSGLDLSSLFGTMTTLNSIVAILAGIASEYLVKMMETKAAPFVASALTNFIAFWIILYTWSENHGNLQETPGTTSSQRTANVIISALRDARILSLALTCCFFEGTMYLFVFFWTPTLQAVHVYQDSHQDDLPLGIIFAAFMASVMLGSLLFSLLVSKHQLVPHSKMLVFALLLASLGLLLSAFTSNEMILFGAFCLFELSVGIYWPSVGYLKGRLVEDEIRGSIYGLLRIPLNSFVVLVLSLLREGIDYRHRVFIFCSGTLLIIAGAVGLALEA